MKLKVGGGGDVRIFDNLTINPFGIDNFWKNLDFHSI